MKALKIVIASLFVLQVWMVAGVCAGPALPSPVKHKIIVHGVYADDCAPAINADGAAVLDEAARLLHGAPAGTVVLVDGLESRPPATQPQRAAEVASVYLTQHGVDPASVKVEATGGASAIVVCDVRELMCPASGSC